jgi:hypothetical protein
MQVNGTEFKSPEIDSHRYSRLTLDKGKKAIQQRKDSLQQMALEQVDFSKLKQKLTSAQTPHLIQE